MDEQAQKEQIKRQLSESLAKANPNVQGDANQLQGTSSAMSLPAALWAPFVNMFVDHIYDLVKQLVADQINKQEKR